MEVDDKNNLQIGGISVEELREKYGTPLLVLDEAEIRENIRKYVNSFEKNYPEYKVLYAGKAFMNRTLCKILEEEGTGVDVVSGGEMYTALKADFPEKDIYFHGNNKLPQEIKLGLENDIEKFVVDNFYEARLLNKLAKEENKKVEVLVRITPGIEAHTHEYIQTGQIDSKFGVSIADNQALDLIEKVVNYDNLKLSGIHAHIGSQIFALESYQKLIEVLFNFLEGIKEKTGKTLAELDLGGGLGISHIEDEQPPDIRDFVETISEKVLTEAEKHNYSVPKLIVEPGRSIIGSAGTTLYTVGSIKQVPGMTKYVAVDGGMTDNIRPALYNADYQVFLANRCLDKPEEKVTVAGKCCESGDILAKDVEIPVAEPGDILAIPATGAYTFAMASNYNSIPRPAVVLVNEGESSVIVERESYEDLIRNDIIPDKFQ
ncbi:MAG: diaminopimelate decarboxylase [Halanaerobiales bacterium]